MSIALAILGALMVVIALQDLFHNLFHPSARGQISDTISMGVWRIFRRWIRRSLALAGPIAFCCVVLYWLASIVLGFALIFWTRMPDGFAFSAGLDPNHFRSFMSAVNISCRAWSRYQPARTQKLPGCTF